MKGFKYIVFFVSLLNATSIISQNKKVIPSPPFTNPPPQAHFSWTNACFGDTTCFYNPSILCNTYTWTVYGDSTTSHGGHASKVLYKAYDDSVMCYHFNAIGNYTVTLLCYDNHWSLDSQVISIDTATKLAFYYFDCRDVFVNQSTCASSFLWNFGDGQTSTDVSPIHEYADTGNYTVTLIGYQGVISDTLKQSVHIPVISFPSAVFTYTVSHDTAFVHANYWDAGFSWTWFDNTHSSTGQDTFHVYKDSTANYAVSLFAINSCGPVYSVDTIKIIQLGPPPAPNFYYINTCLGDTTCFINQTTGTNTYTWTVTSESLPPHVLYTSNDSNMCFHFPTVGHYQVALLAYGDHYSEEISQVVSIGTIPIAGFSFTHCTNNFTNSSSCATSFNWNFGDGTYSNSIVPIHQYADTGYYQVTLTAYNGNDSNKLTQQIHVDVTSAANANFTSVSSNDTAWFHTSFISIPASTYTWSFGDGGHATGQDTMHIYADTVKTYYVKLSVSNLCGTVSNTDTLKITVPLPPPDLDFSNSILTIVPNPVSNSGYIDAFFNAYSSDNYLTQVYNAVGQKMFEEYFYFEPGINEFKISTVNFASGVYIMVMQSGNSYIRRKFYVIRTP